MFHECNRDQYPFNGQMCTGTGPALVLVKDERFVKSHFIAVCISENRNHYNRDPLRIKTHHNETTLKRMSLKCLLWIGGATAVLYNGRQWFYMYVTEDLVNTRRRLGLTTAVSPAVNSITSARRRQLPLAIDAHVGLHVDSVGI